MSTHERIRSVWFNPYIKEMRTRFLLTLSDTHRTDSQGKSILAYTLTQYVHGKRTVLFEGSDFHCSPLDAIDSDACVGSLMGFLTLRPGDTDSDYFAHYTPEQREFSEKHAESLAAEVAHRFGDDL